MYRILVCRILPSKVSNENKEVYFCSDFNSDLLKMDKVINYKKFYELNCSYGLLPQIVQPTRIQCNAETIVDNIFTNVCNNQIHCGNILTELSRHLSQILPVHRDTIDDNMLSNNLGDEIISENVLLNHFSQQIDIKKIYICRRDYSKYSNESFRDDVSIQNWSYSLDNAHDSLKDFFY